MARLSGTVTYRQRSALPSGSVVRVRLEDVSRQDAPARCLAETEIVTEGEQVPIPFALEAEPTALGERARLALRATIDVEGSLRFATATHHALEAADGPTHVKLVVEPVPDGDEPPLAGTTWELAELGESPVELGSGERAPALVLDPASSRVSGSGGCNRLTGSFELAGGDLRLTPPEHLRRRERARARSRGACSAGPALVERP